MTPSRQDSEPPTFFKEMPLLSSLNIDFHLSFHTFVERVLWLSQVLCQVLAFSQKEKKLESHWFGLTSHLMLLFPCSMFILSMLEDFGDGELPILANSLFNCISQEQKLLENLFLLWGQEPLVHGGPKLLSLILTWGEEKERGARTGEEEWRSGYEKNRMNSSCVAKI